MPYFESDIARFHYYQYGCGKKIMLAFHGFGMRGNQFSVLEQAFGSEYTIYSFDLFFHGDTLLKNTSRKAILNYLSPILFAEQIYAFLESIGKTKLKVALLSYSIGSRLALSLLKELPQLISTAYFIAPDGIEPNKLLEVGAKNKLVNYCFWKLVYLPRTVKFLLNGLYKAKYIDNSLHYILSKEFKSNETRLTCYNTITYLSQLSFDKEDLAEKINANGIDCHFYFGKKDKLFPPAIGYRFAPLLQNVNVHAIDDGHDLVNQNLNELLMAHLNQLQTS